MTGDEGAAPRAILGAVDDEGWISGPCGGVVDGAAWICEVGSTADDCWWNVAPILTKERCASAAECHAAIERGRARAAELADEDVCEHEHDEECFDDQGYASGCHHMHCFACGECGCAGYCDDHQTYNLRPAETGGDVDESEA